MADILTDSRVLFRKVSAKKKLATKAEVLSCLKQAEKLAFRVEAAKTVTGGISTAFLDAIDSALRIATPLAAIFGDFELTTLLSSLKVWIEKKRREAAEEEAAKFQSYNNGTSYTGDWGYTYSY